MPYGNGLISDIPENMIEYVGDALIEVEVPVPVEWDPEAEPIPTSMHLTLEQLLAWMGESQDSTYIGATPPDPGSGNYKLWLCTDESSVGAYTNFGTFAQPVWVESTQRGPRGLPGPAGGPVVAIPADYGVPYPTQETLGGRTVWAVRVDCGALPNAQNKEIPIPAAALDVIEQVIHVSGWSHDPTSGNTYPLPMVNTTQFEAGVQLIVFNHASIRLHSGVNRTNFTQTEVTLKFLRNDDGA